MANFLTKYRSGHNASELYYKEVFLPNIDFYLQVLFLKPRLFRD